MAEEIIIKVIRINSEQAVEALNDVNEATEKVDGSLEKMDSQLQEIPGPLGKVQKGVQGLSKAFKALLANPIVLLIAALVAALAGLFKAFTKTQEGADKMNDVMAQLSAAMDVIIARAAQIFKALGKIFQGKFKEGFEDMGEAVKGVGDELREAAAAARDYEAAVRSLYRAETDLITVNAERRKQIEEQLFISKTLTNSIEERRQAIIRAAEIEEEMLMDQIALQEQRVALAQATIDMNAKEADNREELRLLAEAEAVLNDLEAESLGRRRGLKEELNALDGEAAAMRAEERRIAGEETLAQIEAIKAARLAAMTEEQQAAQAEAEWMMELDEEMARLDKEFKDAEMAAQTAAADHAISETQRKAQAEEDAMAAALEREWLLQDVKAQIYDDGINALLGFLGEGSKAAKAVMIADATKSAILGAINTFTSVSAITGVGPILAPIAAAAALAAGMANVRKIAMTPAGIPQASGGGSVPSVSLGQPSAPSTGSFDDLTQTDIGIADDVNIVQDATRRNAVRSYVVESELTAEQEIAQKREAEVTL